MSGRIFLAFLIFFLAGFAAAQNYGPNIQSGSKVLNEKTYNGFSTKFDFKKNSVEKGWWAYSRKFGVHSRKNGYYQVTLANENPEQPVDLKLLSHVAGEDSSSTFFLCLDTDGVPEGSLAKYQHQVKAILAGFKKHYYLHELEKELEAMEKRAARAGKRIGKTPSGDNKHQIMLLQELQAVIASKKKSLKLIYQSNE